MLRTTLDHQLDDLRAAVLDTGTLVTDAIARASEALLRGDHALAADVIAGDSPLQRFVKKLAICYERSSMACETCFLAPRVLR